MLPSDFFEGLEECPIESFYTVTSADRCFFAPTLRTWFFLYVFNTVPLHSSKYNSQRLNRPNRELILVANWSKELPLIKDCTIQEGTTLIEGRRDLFQKRAVVFSNGPGFFK